MRTKSKFLVAKFCRKHTWKIKWIKESTSQPYQENTQFLLGWPQHCCHCKVCEEKHPAFFKLYECPSHQSRHCDCRDTWIIQSLKKGNKNNENFGKQSFWIKIQKKSVRFSFRENSVVSNICSQWRVEKCD